MKTKITNERKEELKDLAEDHLNNREWFDYHDWDGLIECDESMTDEELEWLRKNATVTVVVTIREGF